MNDNLLFLAMVAARQAIRPEDSLEDRCRAAMKGTYRHWMVTDEDTQFKAAVAAVYEQTSDEDERQRIKDELESLRDLAALLSGVNVDIEAIRPLENPIGLRNLWVEVAGRG